MPVKVWESPDKRVQKKIIKTGEFTKAPSECSTVHLTIENITVNGVPPSEHNAAVEQFNSTILDGVAEKILVIGESCCVLDQQIERALQLMTVNEKSLITVLHATDPVDFLINAPATIKFEVTLTKSDIHNRIWEWAPEEKYQVAFKYKEMGVRLYVDGRREDAFLKFSRACKILITMEPITDLDLESGLLEKINKLRLILYNNMAGCQLNRSNFSHGVRLCDKVLEKDKNNVKALYRRGIAYGNLTDVDRAAEDMERVLTLEPHNTAAQAQYAKYNTKVREAQKSLADMAKRMFKQ